MLPRSTSRATSWTTSPDCWPPTGGGLRTPRGSRALGPFRQAVLVLRWFRERACVHCLARDAGVSQATGYRYLHEGIDVLADQAPDLHDVLNRCRRDGHDARDPGRHPHRVRPPRGRPRQRQRPVVQPETQGIRRQRAVPVRPRTAPRCGSPTSSPAPPPTSPPPASTHCPPSTRPPPTACRPSPTRATSAPASASTSRSAAPRASPNKPSTPTPAPRTP